MLRLLIIALSLISFACSLDLSSLDDGKPDAAKDASPDDAGACYLAYLPCPFDDASDCREKVLICPDAGSPSNGTCGCSCYDACANH